VAENKIERLISNIGRVFFGKSDAVRLTVVALIARGHLLIEDVPGVGKTLLGIALARSIEASFKRIQFTNDLLPSDILGLSILKNGGFDFRAGPIFSNVVLADEINRTTPKTQSALLEAMNDLHVSIEGETRPLPDPFLVIATQNPVEYHGTFPLPEAQLDRFLMRLQIGYPAAEDEKRILREKELALEAGAVHPVLTVSDVKELQRRAEQVRVEEPVMDYVVRLANATRSSDRLKLGLSPRGALSLCRAAQAYALTLGRDFCEPDDVKRVAVPVVAHRVVVDSNAYGVARVREAEALVEDLVRTVPSPV
jgi:MoxR-like ATPase